VADNAGLKEAEGFKQSKILQQGEAEAIKLVNEAIFHWTPSY
jgi:hypothetical protein